MMTSLSAFVTIAARLGRVRAIREAAAIAAFAEANYPGLRAEADGGEVRLQARGLKRRWVRGEARLLSLLEDVRLAARRTR